MFWERQALHKRLVRCACTCVCVCVGGCSWTEKNYYFETKGMRTTTKFKYHYLMNKRMHTHHFLQKPQTCCECPQMDRHWGAVWWPAQPRFARLSAAAAKMRPALTTCSPAAPATDCPGCQSATTRTFAPLRGLLAAARKSWWPAA